MTTKVLGTSYTVSKNTNYVRVETTLGYAHQNPENDLEIRCIEF